MEKLIGTLGVSKSLVRQQITEKIRCEEGFYPILLWNLSMKHKSKTKLCNLSMLSFSQAILLGRVRTRELLLDAMKFQVFEELMTYELASTITLKGSYFCLTCILSKCLKL